MVIKRKTEGNNGKQNFLFEPTKPPIILEFESEAEQVAYDILSKLSEEYGLTFDYQYSIYEHIPFSSNWRDWVIEKWGTEGVPDWISHASKPENCDNIFDCKYCYTIKEKDYEKYRLDFLLNKGGKLLNLEIDGRDFHDPEADSKRDLEVIERLKCKVKRFKGIEVYQKEGKKVKNYLKIWAGMK
ncbi:hypothetical protein HY989_04215 [Candidatus Micrarchaeota archaeon]|nr:hypothetical protein [Candidatus Micrarchaeota archaeon]